MSRDPNVRVAEKEAQLKRLAAKGTPGYGAMYAAQPRQVRRAAEQKAARLAQRDERSAADALALAEAKGAALGFKLTGRSK
jgi:hypothetical protein